MSMSQRKTFCRTSKVLLPLARLILQSEWHIFKRRTCLLATSVHISKRCGSQQLRAGVTPTSCVLEPWTKSTHTFWNPSCFKMDSSIMSCQGQKEQKCLVVTKLTSCCTRSRVFPRRSSWNLLNIIIEYNKISFGEGGRMRSLSRVSRKQRYSTLAFPAENRVPTGMQNSPESIKAFAVFDVTFNIYS